jgi:hypothetical protein
MGIGRAATCASIIAASIDPPVNWAGAGLMIAREFSVIALNMGKSSNWSHRICFTCPDAIFVVRFASREPTLLIHRAGRS